MSGAAGGFFGSLGATAWSGAGGKWNGIGGKYAGSAVGTIAFGDPLMSGRDFAKGIIIGAVLGGVINGGIAKYNGNTFWKGTPPRIAVQPISLPNATELTKTGKPEIRTDAKLPSTTKTNTTPTAQSNTTAKVTFTKNVDGNGYKVEGLGIVDDGGTNVVYRGIDKVTGKVKYIGITERSPGIRFNEHLNSIDTGKELLRYEVIDGMENLNRINARIF